MQASQWVRDPFGGLPPHLAPIRRDRTALAQSIRSGDTLEYFPPQAPTLTIQTTLGAASVLLGALLLSACSSTSERTGASIQATPDPGYTLLQMRDERKLPESLQTIVVDNPYGEIQLRQTQSRSLAYHANEQRIGTAPRTARIEWIQDVDLIGLRVRYDEHDPATPANPTLGRVDLAIFVPSGVRLDLRTDFGNVVVRRVRNPVDARSRSGRIVVAARDAMQLRSETGELRAFPMQGDWSRPLLLQTGGNVIADVPLYQGLRLDVKAGNSISPNFALDSVMQASDGSWAGALLRPAGELQMQINAGGDVNLLGMKAPIP